MMINRRTFRDEDGRAERPLAFRLPSSLFLSRRLLAMSPSIRLRRVATLFGSASNVLMVAYAAMICGLSAWKREHSIAMVAISGCEVGLLIVRSSLILAFQKAERRSMVVVAEPWLAPFALLAIASSCCWGAMCFITLTLAHDPIVYVLPVICTVATAGAVSARNSGVPRLAQAQLACSLLPILAGCALTEDDGSRPLLLLVPAMAFGLLVLIKERHGQLVTLIETQSELQRLSNTDALTQIANRRAFDLALAATCIPGTTVALMMIDVDHFKLYNDRHGHFEGDILLRKIAATLQDGLGARRGSLARIGGEEFSILLARVEADDVFAMAEGIRRLVASTCRDPSDNRPVTISIGLAMVGDGDRARLLKDADKALYVAKNGGRNRTADIALAAAA